MAFKRSAVRSRLSPPTPTERLEFFLYLESLSGKQTTATRSRLSPPTPTERLEFILYLRLLRVFQAYKQQRFDVVIRIELFSEILAPRNIRIGVVKPRRTFLLAFSNALCYNAPRCRVRISAIIVASQAGLIPDEKALRCNDFSGF